MSYDDYPEPDLDDLTREQLAEYDPAARAVADALDEWLFRLHGVTAGFHNAGAFLEFLALGGYTVTAMEPVTPLEELLGEPDNASDQPKPAAVVLPGQHGTEERP